jgi:uncharacterized surface protein with fasciclin (FAS1) repeats
MFKTLTLAVSAIALLSFAQPVMAEHIHADNEDAPVATEGTAHAATEEAAPAAAAATATEETAPAAAAAAEEATPAAATPAEATEEAAPAPDAAVAGDIVATAASNPDFSTLVSAIKAADLTSALQGEGPFTVFAPSNAAFKALPAGELDDLLKPENKGKLQDLLKYHVVAGKISAADIKDGETELDTMLEGKTLKVVKTAEGVTVNGAKVSAVDVPASNGVIHVIDAVATAK